MKDEAFKSGGASVNGSRAHDANGWLLRNSSGSAEHRSKAKLLIGLGLLLILGVTLVPFDFTVRNRALDWKLFLLSAGTETAWEMVANCLLYFPLGIGLGTYLWTAKRKRFRTVVVLVVLAGFGISYTCEFLQLFLPSRYSTWQDVASNTLGGLFGFLFVVYRENESRLLSFSAYVFGAFVFAVYLQQHTTFRNWDDSFPLMVGNEHEGNRPWAGEVYEFFITNRSVSATEAREIARIGADSEAVKNYLVAHYRLAQSMESASYIDATGQLPPLVPIVQSPCAGGVNSPQCMWFETPGPVPELTRAVANTSQFTLSALLTSANENQTGPARIISLSFDWARRNFTLGQEGPDLVFRLRTPLTGKNGVNPDLRVPNVFSSSEPRQITVTYDGEDLFIYIDGSLAPNSLELSAERAMFPIFHGLHPRLAKIVFYALLFCPTGMLLARLLTGARRRRAPLIVAAGCLVLPLVLEGLMVATSGRGPKLENILFGVSFMFISWVTLRIVYSVRKPEHDPALAVQA